jgi:heterodisulfide reductase subunit B
MVSVHSMCETLDIELNEIPDWNCCSASIGYAGGGELPRLALSARNMAISEQANPGQDIVATCAACWLATKETQERLHDDDKLMAETNEALAQAGLKVEASQNVRHMVEVLIEDFGYEELGKHVKKFGIDGESYENPKYLDKLVETMGAEPVENYDKKVSCCGGALAFSEPEKSQALIKDIIESAYDGGADMIVTPCPVCQMNVEVYQDHINQKYKTNFKMPVVYYSTLMSVAYGGSGKDAGLDGQIIKAKQLEELASR